MVKKSKRKQDIKSKLLAAIAMLMVATIMMVSSTYAWFTLSTAPEVQGITTNVGSNGNLEIALSPLSGNASEITSNVGDYNDPWTVKNLTWGNLLDLSDASYGLGSINLLPSQLNLGSLGSSPLKTPVYGEDGRISTLEANTVIGGLMKDENGALKEGYYVDGGYGVRVVGTSSNRTEYEITFANNFSAMNAAVINTQKLAEISLNANGKALAEIAIAHANAGGEDNNEYVTYVSALQAMVAKLQEANNELEAAIRAALLATASSNLLPTGGADQDTAIAAYNAVVALVIPQNDLPTIWSGLSSVDSRITAAAIGDAYAVWEDVNEALNGTDGAVATLSTLPTEDLPGTTEVAWSNISGVMAKLMNTTGVKINNQDLSTLKQQASTWQKGEPKIQDYQTDGNWTTGTSEQAYNDAMAAYATAQTLINSLLDGVNLQLNAGSGVYADLASVVGNIHSAVENVAVAIPGMGTLSLDVNIDTTTGSSAAMVTYKTGLQILGALQVTNAGGDAVIDVTYAYIVDFLFRTNASGSNLMLQTDATQRIYEDGTNEATMGGGSTMTFYSTALNEQAVKGLMDAIRVVFIDPASDALLGVAKLDMNAVTTADKEVNGETVKAITASLYLYEYTQDPMSGKLTFTTQKAADQAILCALQANTAKAVSAMVYLDGDYVTNENVAAEASSMTGELNLQFASDANLIPMDNSALQNG